MAGIAKANFVRYSPRKVGQILDLIRNKNVLEAFNILKFVHRAAAILLSSIFRLMLGTSFMLSFPSGPETSMTWSPLSTFTISGIAIGLFDNLLIFPLPYTADNFSAKVLFARFCIRHYSPACRNY